MAGKGLVSGGAGYIGAHACKVLKAAGFTPVVYDNLSTGHAEAVKFGRWNRAICWTAPGWTRFSPPTSRSR